MLVKRGIYSMSAYLKHTRVVLRHKIYVMRECFKIGLYWQGFVHDLSKFGITEFFASAQYFQGDKTIDVEKKKAKYDYAWLHHMGHNKHHWQYWIDYNHGSLSIIRMPPKYLAEMLCDWIGAGKAYNESVWTPETFTTWVVTNIPNMHLHVDTRNYIFEVLKNIEEMGEEQSIGDYISTEKIMKYYEKIGPSNPTIIQCHAL